MGALVQLAAINGALVQTAAIISALASTALVERHTGVVEVWYMVYACQCVYCDLFTGMQLLHNIPRLVCTIFTCAS